MILKFSWILDFSTCGGAQWALGVLRNHTAEEGAVIAGKFSEADTYFMVSVFALRFVAI